MDISVSEAGMPPSFDTDNMMMPDDSQFYLRRRLFGSNDIIPVPPPPPKIQPGHGGPIVELTPNDVLSGRGSRINGHEGNVRFRKIVIAWKPHYADKASKNVVKAHIAAHIVNHIRSLDPPGRFLRKDDKTGLWLDIGDENARKKAAQSLRDVNFTDNPPQKNGEKDKKDASAAVDNGVASKKVPKKVPTPAASPTPEKMERDLKSPTAEQQPHAPPTVKSPECVSSFEVTESYQPQKAAKSRTAMPPPSLKKFISTPILKVSMPPPMMREPQQQQQQAQPQPQLDDQSGKDTMSVSSQGTADTAKRRFLRRLTSITHYGRKKGSRRKSAGDMSGIVAPQTISSISSVTSSGAGGGSGAVVGGCLISKAIADSGQLRDCDVLSLDSLSISSSVPESTPSSAPEDMAIGALAIPEPTPLPMNGREALGRSKRKIFGGRRRSEMSAMAMAAQKQGMTSISPASSLTCSGGSDLRRAIIGAQLRNSGILSMGEDMSQLRDSGKLSVGDLSQLRDSGFLSAADLSVLNSSVMSVEDMSLSSFPLLDEAAAKLLADAAAAGDGSGGGGSSSQKKSDGRRRRSDKYASTPHNKAMSAISPSSSLTSSNALVIAAQLRNSGMLSIGEEMSLSNTSLLREEAEKAAANRRRAEIAKSDGSGSRRVTQRRTRAAIGSSDASSLTSSATSNLSRSIGFQLRDSDMMSIGELSLGSLMPADAAAAAQNDPSRGVVSKGAAPSGGRTG